MACTSSGRPAFIFSYNATDPDVVALANAASSSSSRHAGLGASHAREGNPSYGYNDANDDDWVPTYGPTTHRRGPMRFVPAHAAQFGVIPATDDGAAPTIDLKGKGRAVKQEVEVDEQEEDVKPDLRRVVTAPRLAAHRLNGGAVRGLYAGIVGLASSAPTSHGGSPAPQSRGELQRASSAPLKREADASPPPLPPAFADEDDVGVLALSSDEESDPADEADRAREDDSEDDIIVVDPLTGQPEEPRSPTSSSTRRNRPQPLLIHQLLPSNSSTTPAPSGAIPPFVPTPQYAIRHDNPGFRMLLRQGWREGRALGPPAAPGEEERGLKVPLRAREKFDRRGLGGGAPAEGERRLSAREREELRRREEREEREQRRGKGARGMERLRKDEERRRKAMIAYMNR